MKYTTKLCPHCGKTITVLDSTKHQYGSPFRTCPKCHKGYVDKSFIELACTVEHADDISRVTGSSIACIVLSIVLLTIALIGGINAGGSVLFLGGLFFLPLSIYSAYKDAKTYRQRLEEFRIEMDESKKRLSDPEYVRALLEIDQHVPPAYIEEAKKKLNAAKKLDSIFQSHLQTCEEILTKSGIKYTPKNLLDVYALAYVVSDFAFFNANKDRDVAIARMIPHIIEKMSTLTPADAISKLRSRTDFYSRVISGIPLHAHCLPGVDISDANPILCCAIAFSDCLAYDEYISNYDAPAPMLNSLETFDIATDALMPLNEALSCLFNDIYDYAAQNLP